MGKRDTLSNDLLIWRNNSVGDELPLLVIMNLSGIEFLRVGEIHSTDGELLLLVIDKLCLGRINTTVLG